MSNAESAEWHSEHGVLYKIFYMVPIFFTFRMRIYAGFTLSEVTSNNIGLQNFDATYIQVSCIMAGLGAYPASSKPRSGQGPTLTPVQWNEGEEVICTVIICPLDIVQRCILLKYIAEMYTFFKRIKKSD